jgi:hypothetical protein
VEGKAKREAGFPGESLVFEVSPGPDGTDDDISWSGGGSPAAGTGRRFITSFDSGGTYTVTASSRTASLGFQVTICPLEAWLARAQEFYGASIAFSLVRVKSSWAVFGPSGTGWTCNDVIRFKRPRRAEDLPHEPTLIHELGHVWEHQTRQVQLFGGLIEQLERRFGRDPYDYGGPDGVAHADRLTAFKKESQAQILTEYWKAGHGYQEDKKGVAFSTPGYVENLQQLVEGAGIGTRHSGRRGLGSVLDSAAARIVNAALQVLE